MSLYEITSDTNNIVIRPSVDYSLVTSIDCCDMDIRVEFPKVPIDNEKGTKLDYNPTRKFGGYVTDDSIYWSEVDYRWKGDEVENDLLTEFKGDGFSMDTDDWCYMFAFCPNLTKVDLGASSSSITSAHSLFYKCSSITEWHNIKMPKCVDLEQCFYGNINLTNADIDLADYSNVENAIKMFGYTSLRSVDTTPMSKLKSMNYMFLGCKDMTDAVINLESCENMSHAFVSCESLSSLTFLNDKGSVRDITSLFNSQGDGGYWKLQYGGDANLLNNPQIKEFHLNGSSLENATSLMNTQTSLTHDGKVAMCPIEVFDLNNGNDSCPNLLKISDLNKGSNLREVIIKDADKVADSSSLFSGLTRLERIELGHWDGLTKANSMFDSSNISNSILNFSSNGKFTANNMFRNCLGIDSWDFNKTPNLTNGEGMFNSCVNLSSVISPSLPYVTSTKNMFSGCSGLQRIDMGDMPLLTTSELMFVDCGALTDVVIGDCKSLNNTKNMFSGCNSLSSVTIENPKNISNIFSGNNSVRLVDFGSCTDLTAVTQFSNSGVLESVSMRDCSSLTKLDNMLKGCSSLTSATIVGLDKCTTSQAVFSGCGKLSVVDVDLHNVGNCTNMFAECKSLTSYTNNDCGELINASTMFNGCSGLTSVYMVTPKLTGTSKMFSGCSSLSSVTLSGIRKFSTDMFSGCTKLEVVDFGECPYLSAGGFSMNTTIKSVTMRNCSTFSGMSSGFKGCANLEYVDFGDGFPMMSAMTAMFSGCSKIKEINMGSCPSVGKPSYNASGIPSYNGANQMFSMCGSLTSVTMTDLENISNTSEMFKGCSSLTSVNLGNVPNIGTNFIKDLSGNVGNASVSNMFSGCSSLSSITFNGADKMVNSTNMFLCCSGLTSFSISGFALLNNTSSMFANCVSLKSVDLGRCPMMGAIFTNESGKTSNPTFSKMFSGCTALESVKIEMPNCTGITNTDMFSGCTSLKSVDFGSCPNMVNIGAIFVATNTSLESLTINDCEGISAKTMFGATLTSVTDIYMSGLSETAQASIKSKNQAKVPNATWHF